MSIRLKLAVIFIAIASVPLVLVSVLTFTNFKNSLEDNRFAQLYDLAVFRADRIEDYFSGLKGDIEMARGFYNIQKNLPILTRLSGRPDNQESIAARKMLNDQLGQMQSVSNMTDIMLAGPKGAVLYSNMPKHAHKDLSTGIGAERMAFSNGKTRVFFSDVYFDSAEDKRYKMLVTAPATDLEGAFCGVIAFEVDMTPVYKLIQDTTGLGKTGEVLVASKTGNQAVFLNPLRHDPKAALKRKTAIGDPSNGIPMQHAVQGGTGSGLSIDYRGEPVIAAWRYVPSMGWGLVAKIDTREAFADVQNLGNLVLLVLLIVFALCGIMAFSMAQSISGPISALSKGTEIIGTGNLDYRVGTRQRDEIGRLSRSFDKMTSDLKTTLASRDELNREIERRKAAEREQEMSIEFLRLVNNSRGFDELMKSAVLFFKEKSGFEAVGIRIKKGEDFPYFETRGFSDRFVLAEKHLCSRDDKGLPLRDAGGYPIMECMCGNVLQGRSDPSKDFFTKHGSFWSNGTTELLATSSDEDRLARTRNRCNGEGYESVGLFALRADGGTLGLLQLNDRRKGMFTPAMLALWERLADHLAVAVSKFLAQEALRESEAGLKIAQEISHLGNWELNLTDNRLQWSDEVYRIFGLKPQEFGATYEAFLDAVHPDDRGAVDAAYSGSLREGKDTYEMEHRVVRKGTGEVRIVHEKCEHFRDETGKVVRSVGMVHDITDRKKVEEALRQRTEELRASNEELTFFNRSMVDREERMIELKKLVNDLMARSGRPPRFDVDFGEEKS